MLNLKKLLTKTLSMLVASKTVFTPLVGTAYSSYGGCYYETYGRLVHLHLGISGLTANTSQIVYVLPSTIRPKSTTFQKGGSGTSAGTCSCEINTGGEVRTYSEWTYCGMDVYYII